MLALSATAIPPSSASRRDASLPPLARLGADLTELAAWQRWLAPALPVLTLSAFGAVFASGNYVLLVPVLLAHLLVSVTYTHEVTHGAAGQGSTARHWLLFTMGLILLESGHAFRYTHLYHHSHCLDDDDIEGIAAKQTLGAVLLAGTTFLPRLLRHAIRHCSNARERRWMKAEGVATVVLVASAILLTRWTWAPLVYCLLMWAASVFYPFTAAYLPHFKPQAGVFGQTRTLRGRLLPALLMNLPYHLEHHLYPQVPGQNLARLAARLDPYLVAHGVKPLRVW